MSAQTLSLFLRAIAIVESGDNPQAVGALGERGRFQMCSCVVQAMGGFGDREAIRWEKQLERELLEAGIEPVPFNVALAWNAGAGAVRRGEVPARSYSYAERVVNLMEAMKK